MEAETEEDANEWVSYIKAHMTYANRRASTTAKNTFTNLIRETLEIPEAESVSEDQRFIFFSNDHNLF